MPKIIDYKYTYKVSGSLMLVLNEVMCDFGNWYHGRDFDKEKFIAKLTALYSEFFPNHNFETWEILESEK